MIVRTATIARENSSDGQDLAHQFAGGWVRHPLAGWANACEATLASRPTTQLSFPTPAAPETDVPADLLTG